jgi:hypothetical protein
MTNTLMPLIGIAAYRVQSYRAWETQPVRPIYPSRSATILFLVSSSVFIAGVVILFTASPAAGRLIAVVGVLGASGSSWVNHKSDSR